MIFWIASVAGLAVAYLFGSVPTGYLAGKLLKDIDIREHGSRSVGCDERVTHRGQMAGAGGAADRRAERCGGGLFCPLDLSLALDVAVGYAGARSADFAALGRLRGRTCRAAGARAFDLAELFAGGKSAATGLGVLLAMSWPVGLGAAAVFGVAVAVSRIVSLGSMLGALTAIALVCVLEQPLAYRLLVIAGGLYVIVRHRANIQRLLAGTEPRVGQGAS